LKRRSAVVRLVAALGLVISLMAGLATTTSAQITTPVTFPGFLTYGANECYFASVIGGEDFGLGPANSSVTVQNLTEFDGYIFLYVGNGDGWDEATYAYLSAGASKTFHALDLGIEGNWPVVAVGYHDLDFTSPMTLGCVTKQAVAGDDLPYTSSADTSVSGYNAVTGLEVGVFDELYLPIVQTNCGPGGCWNSILRVANVGFDANAAVTVRFFPADDGSGSLAEGFQVQTLLNIGALWSIDLATLVPEGWVGSAHILTDDAVVATVDRYKAGTDMWITNAASNASAEFAFQDPVAQGYPYVLFAADVRLDYNGWNTGINVANTVDTDNTVNIQYFGSSGNAPQGQSRRLAAHGMTYFYNPSDPSEDDCDQPADQVPTCDFVGGALILSDWPVAAAIDGVKYFGNDANVGQAFSYAASGNVFQAQAFPLVQKGSPSTGMGATSGINFLNPNALATFVLVDWLNPSGFGADNFGDTIVWVPGYSTGFVYTMFQENLPNGFYGSALVLSELPIVTTSANVDYQVQGDGTVVWNGYNPCGLFRQLGDCPWVPPIPTATKIIDTNVEGALVCVYAVGDAGQDGKPELPTECNLLQIFEKDGEEPGQGDPNTYFADLSPGGDDVNDGNVASVTWNPDTNELTANVWIEGAGTPGVSYNAAIFNHVELEDPDNDLFDTIASGQNAICPPGGVLDTDFTGDNVNFVGTGVADEDGDVTFPTLEATLSIEAAEDLGDPENAVVVVYDDDGNIIGCGQLEAGTVRPETPEEAAVRLGAEAVGVTDAEGNVSFDLPLGDYVAIICATGYECATEEFTLDEEGEVEINEVNLTPIAGEEETGVLAKVMIFPEIIVPQPEGPPITIDVGAGINDGSISLNSEVIFCEGIITDTADCDSVFDDAVVAFGGLDDNLDPDLPLDLTDLDPNLAGAFVFAADVATGDYTICTSVSITGDFDGDPLTPDTTIGYDDLCETESDFQFHAALDGSTIEPVTGQITVLADTATVVVNVFASYDVLVTDNTAAALPIPGAEVCLFDAANVELACEETGADGIARFFGVDDGTYTTSASALGYEDESDTYVYTLAGDLASDGGIDGPGTVEQHHALALNPNELVLDVYVTLGTLPYEGAIVNLYLTSVPPAPADVPGTFPTGVCYGVFVASDTTSALGEAEFLVISGQSYCVQVTEAATGETVEVYWVVAPFVAAAGMLNDFPPAADIPVVFTLAP
jgi:hypothetical protein